MAPLYLPGRISAIYMVVMNAGGPGLGPLVVALVADRWFEDSRPIGKSIALVGAIGLCPVEQGGSGAHFLARSSA